MMRGSCLCGAVRYEIAGPLEEMSSCHCTMCQKGHGAAFATYARTKASGFRYVAGQDRVRAFRSSPPIQRSFCSECGSNLTYTFEGLPEAMWVAAGSFDGDPGLRPGAHMFVRSKAPWHEITDTLPRHEAYPPEFSE